MNDLKIGKKGLILNGEFKDWQIFIQDLDNGEGAYLILLTSPDGQGYDDWVENMQSLKGYFEKAKWDILWSNDAEKS